MRPLRGSRFALRQPDAFGAGESRLRHQVVVEARLEVVALEPARKLFLRVLHLLRGRVVRKRQGHVVHKCRGARDERVEDVFRGLVVLLAALHVLLVREVAVRLVRGIDFRDQFLLRALDVFFLVYYPSWRSFRFVVTHRLL